MADIVLLKEVTTEPTDQWHLCFQWCKYPTNGGEHGYRFIWKDENGKLQPHRGQARIQSAKEMFELITKAIDAGWFITVETSG